MAELNSENKATRVTEVYVKIDSRNRITIKKPVAKIYAAEVDESGVIKLVPCQVERVAR